MFIDLLSESCEEGVRVTKMSQYFEGTFPDQPEFLVIFHKRFQLRQTHRIRNDSFYWPHLGNVCQEIIVIIDY